jgi:hypothetical protein
MHKIASCDVFVLLDDVQYTKNGWQNRNRIKGAQGPITLTVPVHDAAFKPINQVRIGQQSLWREKHWKTLVTHYGRAPYFTQFSGVFERAFRTPWDLLASLNLHLLAELCAAFRIRTPLVRSSTLGVGGRATERLVRICRALGATRYLTGAYAAANHMDEHLFADAGIDIEVQGWTCPRYRQQFSSAGFVAELSAVDLLFNEGASSLSVLRAGSPAPVSIGTSETFDRRRDTAVSAL